MKVQWAQAKNDPKLIKRRLKTIIISGAIIAHWAYKPLIRLSFTSPLSPFTTPQNSSPQKYKRNYQVLISNLMLQHFLFILFISTFEIVPKGEIPRPHVPQSPDPTC